MSKITSIKRFMPNLFRPDSNINIKALLEAIGGSDDDVVTQIANAKEQIFVISAVSSFLDTLGSNVGVERTSDPTEFYFTDNLFRQLIPLLSYHPKQIKETMQGILDAFFGVGHPDVGMYEINPSEVVVTMPATLPIIRDELIGTTHFHSHGGWITNIDNTAKTITVNFDDPFLKDEVINFDSTNGFAGSADVTGITLELPKSSTGKHAISFDKSLVTEAFGTLTRTFTYSLDLSSYKHVSYWLYLSDLTDVDKSKIVLKTGANTSTYEIDDSDLIAGWNRITFDIIAPDSIIGAGATLSDVDEVDFVVMLDAAGNTLLDIRLDNFIASETQIEFEVDDFTNKTFSQDGSNLTIVNSTVGKTNITLSFAATADLLGFVKTDRFEIIDSVYPSSYIYDPDTAVLGLTLQRTVLDQNISIGDTGGIISFVDSSDIPDSPGFLVFDFGDQDNEESLVPYLERPTNSSLIIEPAYIFTKDHLIGDVVNVVTSGAVEPVDDGTDYGVFNLGTEEPIDAAQTILGKIKASGVVFRFIVKVTSCTC